ncbi:MAG: helix-turn-helix domain-containing protein [Gammaproteobacteria bacterium]
MSESDAVFSAEFQDFDAYVEAVKDADVEMKLTSLDVNHWALQSMHLPNGINLQMGSEGGGSIAMADNPAAGALIFLHRGCLVHVNGKEMHPGSAFIIPPDSEFIISDRQAHLWLSIFVPEALMQDLGLNEDSRGNGFRRPRLVHQDKVQSDLLWNYVDRFLSAADGRPEISNSTTALLNFQGELVDKLRAGYGRQLEPREARRGRPVVTDRIMVGRAIDAIEASADGKVPVENLVDVTGVSERSLRAAFRRYLGVSPTVYMQLRILNKARERLVRAGPKDTTVTLVAADLGQWDVGRFAARYKKVFGESPSATLQITA